MIKIKNPSKILVLSCISLIIIGTAIGIYFFLQNKNSQTSTTANAPVGSDTDKLNLEPPSKEDLQRAEDNKQKVSDKIDQESQQNQQPTEGKKYNPVITFAGVYDSNIEVGGYVDAFEEGGVCTVTFQKDNNKVTKSNEGIRNANSVNCPTFMLPSTEFPATGTWQLSLSYSSSTGNGASAVKQIEIK